MTLRLQQFGRVIRLFIMSFTHSAWAGLLTLPWPARTALASVAVGATEAAYRTIQPPISTGLAAAQTDHLTQIIESVVSAQLEKRSTPPVSVSVTTSPPATTETKTQP